MVSAVAFLTSKHLDQVNDHLIDIGANNGFKIPSSDFPSITKPGNNKNQCILYETKSGMGKFYDLLLLSHLTTYGIKDISINTLICSLKVLIESNEDICLGRNYNLTSSHHFLPSKNKLFDLSIKDQKLFHSLPILQKSQSCPRGDHRIIIISVDKSFHSKDQIEWARDNILKPGDIVILASVWDDLFDESTNLKFPGMILMTKKNIVDYNTSTFLASWTNLRKLFDRYLYDFNVYPIIIPQYKNSKSTIGNILCQFAKELSANMIVIGSNCHGAVYHFFFGSVSKYVIEHSSCPVTIVKH